jgi:hypothetical protein
MARVHAIHNVGEVGVGDIDRSLFTAIPCIAVRFAAAFSLLRKRHKAKPGKRIGDYRFHGCASFGFICGPNRLHANCGGKSTGAAK